jgi:hypothetical protein
MSQMPIFLNMLPVSSLSDMQNIMNDSIVAALSEHTSRDAHEGASAMFGDSSSYWPNGWCGWQLALTFLVVLVTYDQGTRSLSQFHLNTY